jgi:hypothetical protein
MLPLLIADVEPCNQGLRQQLLHACDEPYRPNRTVTIAITLSLFPKDSKAYFAIREAIILSYSLG